MEIKIIWGIPHQIKFLIYIITYHFIVNEL